MDLTLLQMQFVSIGKNVVLKVMDSLAELKLIAASSVSKYTSMNPNYVMGFYAL